MVSADFMIADLHNDMLTALSPREYAGYLDGIREYASPVLAIWSTRLDVAPGFLKDLVSAVPKEFARFALEDAHFLGKQSLGLLSEIPLLYAGLTWNDDNALAGGAKAGTSKGLTERGKAVIREAERLGIAVDTAHLNRKSFFDVLDYAQGKLLCSHCCFDAVYSHPRNLTDEQIKLIVSRGGIVGVTSESSFLTKGNAAYTDVVRHIDYFVQKFGCDNLAVGSDFNGCTPPDGLNDYPSFSVLTDALEKIGYTQSDIRKIFSLNAKKFFADRF